MPYKTSEAKGWRKESAGIITLGPSIIDCAIG